MKKKEVAGFESFNLSVPLMRAIREMGFEEPTPIQELTIPPALEGSDIIAQAQTGTGKTASFGIPAIEKYAHGKKPYAIIIEPTRELALQVAKEIMSLGKYTNSSILAIYGGMSMERQIQKLHKGTNIIVGTPGRIIDHLERKTLSVENISMIVLDEADEMLNMGFIEDIEKILKMLPASRQTMLFSATMPSEIVKIARRHMNNPLRFTVNVKDIITPKIKQVFYEVREMDKPEVLTRLLDVESPELTLIFCHTKREVDEVAARLNQLGYNAGALHGDFTQSHREDMMARFREGDIDILVATDVAGRGIDIENISHVINYSIPQNPEGYIHRIGRTGRAGRTGIALTFVTPREYRQLQQIEKMAKTKLSRREIPTVAEVKKARQRMIKEDITEAIAKENHRPFLSVVRELSGALEPDEIAATALSIAFGDMNISEIGKQNPQVREDNMTRLFMTVGRKDRVQTSEILRTVAEEAGIPGHRIGKIDIMNNFTFFEVPSEIVEKVLTTMNKIVMRGKKISVEKAKPQKKSKKQSRGKNTAKHK